MKRRDDLLPRLPGRALPLLVAAALGAAPPLAAQGAAARPAFRGDGFQVSLPEGVPPPVPQAGKHDGRPTVVYLSYGPAWAVSITRFGAAAGRDTTPAARRELLRRAPAEYLQLDENLRRTGTPREVDHPDRHSLRVPVGFPGPGGEELDGLAELSVPRAGEPAVWLVAVIARHRGAAQDAEKKRVLDSFRLTGPP